MTTRTQHAIIRTRHPLSFRRLTVGRVEMLTPKMRRVVFGGADLEGFTTLGFDDHVKLFFPDSSGVLPTPAVVDGGLRFPDDGPRPEGRDFTPRRYDAAARELTIDFGLHGSGPATAWAARCAIGDTIGAGGPRGSAVVSHTFDWHLLVGDETAIPAVARRLEELPASASAIAVLQVEDATEEQAITAGPRASIRWVHRHDSQGTTLESVVASLDLPAGDGFAWVAGEASLARRVRDHFVRGRKLNPEWIKAAAYWRVGAVSKHEVIAD